MLISRLGAEPWATLADTGQLHRVCSHSFITSYGLHTKIHPEDLLLPPLFPPLFLKDRGPGCDDRLYKPDSGLCRITLGLSLIQDPTMLLAFQRASLLCSLFDAYLLATVVRKKKRGFSQSVSCVQVICYYDFQSPVLALAGWEKGTHTSHSHVKVFVSLFEDVFSANYFICM